jgi:hypothetical protein
MSIKPYIIIGLISVIGLLVWWFGFYVPNHMPVDPNQELIEKIDSLTNKIDSIQNKQDSINKVIDTTEVKIIKIHETYKTTVERIINQPVDSDRVFLTNYLHKYSRQLDSLKSNGNKDFESDTGGTLNVE